MDEFFDNGGTTSFIDRLCASLGIHASTVKVVGVSSGSVVVDYEITPSADEPLSMAQIQARQTEQFATGALDLGAPILDVSGSMGSVVENGVTTAEGFKAVILVPSAANAGDQIWVSWIEPFMWEALQIVAVDVPADIFYNGLYGGLAWVWHELAYEVEEMARQAEIDRAHEEHVPNVAPQEGDEEPVFEGDDGNTGTINDEDDTGGL